MVCSTVPLPSALTLISVALRMHPVHSAAATAIAATFANIRNLPGKVHDTAHGRPVPHIRPLYLSA